MTTVVSARLHSAAVVTALKKAGHPVGDGVAPDDKALPYSVVYDVPGGSLDGPVSDPDADAEIPFQVTIVGATAEQARALADKVRDSLASIDVEGRHVLRLQPDGGLGAVQRDDASKPPLFYLTPRWRLFTTPA